jgi:hypothetical protein
MFKLRSRLSYAIVGVTLAVVLGASGFAIASIPGHGGIIHACYQKHSGGLRVIDRSKRGFAGTCRKSEKSLTWNQTGPPGIPGPQGSPGPQGPAGASVMVRARNSTPLVVPSGTTGTYSLNGGSWTQAATETDLFFGQVTVTMPASCGYGLVTVTVMLGSVATRAEADFVAVSGASTQPFSLSYAFEPGVATARSASLSVQNGCGPGQDVTVDSGALDVAGLL